MGTLADIRRNALRSLIPPPRVQLSEWIESNVLVATEPLKWYGDREDHPPWIKALAEVRQRATREGWYYHHVQAIILAIDQYRITAIGGKRHGDNYQGDLVLCGSAVGSGARQPWNVARQFPRTLALPRLQKNRRIARWLFRSTIAMSVLLRLADATRTLS
jgi:hypothetical protein